jgi:hypothetical protein
MAAAPLLSMGWATAGAESHTPAIWAAAIDTLVVWT